MKQPILLTIFISIATASSPAFAQGKVDKDWVLYHIRMDCRKIDRDTTLHYLVEQDSGSSRSSFIIWYSRSNCMRKLSRLTRYDDGTEIVTFYYDEQKPVLILAERNNFHLSNDRSGIYKVINTFKRKVDTVNLNNASYEKKYQAKYYFYHEVVRFAAVVFFTSKGEVKSVRNDNRKDVQRAMELFNEGIEYASKNNFALTR